ncbi:hypothetical protein HCJ76_43870 [Streptomyces sp. MC1]|uniref:hypothetical protein n=1 Tax=Streptomyces sp. MC1 TaxID=295105 RepID=UPI0018CA5B6C|nr:hypothetical protein [Streptomyces sp. MC1]MBG7704821.1 hypothetical protein [Streptomyces sp. MC1]
MEQSKKPVSETGNEPYVILRYLPSADAEPADADEWAAAFIHAADGGADPEQPS